MGYFADAITHGEGEKSVSSGWVAIECQGSQELTRSEKHDSDVNFFFLRIAMRCSVCTYNPFLFGHASRTDECILHSGTGMYGSVNWSVTFFSRAHWVREYSLSFFIVIIM